MYFAPTWLKGGSRGSDRPL